MISSENSFLLSPSPDLYSGLYGLLDLSNQPLHLSVHTGYSIVSVGYH